jgi:hypothetical protein
MSLNTRVWYSYQVRSSELCAGLVLRWPRPWRGKMRWPSRDGGKARLFPNATPHTNDVTTRPFLSITYSISPIANILHTYTGKIMLSFCPDIASSTDPSPMIAPYRTTWRKKWSAVLPSNIFCKLAENSSTNPQIRNAHANATTDTVNPALPSNVLGVVGDHLYRPTLFPTTEACVRVIRSSLL